MNVALMNTALVKQSMVSYQPNGRRCSARRQNLQTPLHRPRPLPLVGLLALILTLLLTGCGFRQTGSVAQDEYRPIRSPYPTFTPTPLSAANGEPIVTTNAENSGSAQPPATTAEAAEVATPPAAAPVVDEEPPAAEVEQSTAPPRLVISSPLVNVRAGPGTNYPILTTVERGQEFEIVGQNDAGDWWRFCCINDAPAWVINELVETDGAVDDLPVSDAVAAVPPTATAAPVAAAPPAQAAPTQPPEPAPTEPPAAPAFGFELQNAEQFPENKLVRIFLYVFDGDQALDGYSLRVMKDGAEQSVTQSSVGGQPSLTWPIADARQRFQNMKLEFPGVAPAGTWEIQLVDGGGNVVGPPATFVLDGNDSNQELYVRYKKL